MKRIAFWHGVLAAANTAVAGSALTGLIGQKAVGVCALMVAAAQAYMTTFLAYLPRGYGDHE